MAKRFTDTEKYKKPFIRGLKGAYKLFWDYLYHSCDHAGIWIVDFEIAQIYLGSDMQVNKQDALKYFNQDEQRIIQIDNNKKWFILPFIVFQYGELNPQNRAHLSVINILKRNNLYDDDKGLVSSLQGAMDKDKDKDMDTDKDKEQKNKNFQKFWNQYGKKVDTKKCQKKWDSFSLNVQKEILESLPEYIESTPNKKFRKNPLTYLNGECWKDEILNGQPDSLEEMGIITNDNLRIYK